MRASLYIYDPAEKGIQMLKTEPFVGLEGMPGVDRDPSHLRNTYNTEEELYEVVTNLVADYEKVAPEIIEYQTFETDDAEVLIIAHGIVPRAAQAAVKALRSQGIKAGHFRPLTIRPFPTEELRAVAAKAKKLLVVESAQGQFQRLVKDALYGLSVPMASYFKPGQGITSEEIVEEIKGGL